MAQPRIDRSRPQSSARSRASEASNPVRANKSSRIAQLPRIIATDDDVREGVRALAAQVRHHAPRARHGRPSAAAAAPGRVRGPRPHHRRPAGLGRQRDCDLDPDGRSLPPVRAARAARPQRRQLAAAGPVPGQNPHRCAPSPRPAATVSTLPAWTAPARSRCTPRSPKWSASGPGRPTSTSCSAWAAPTAGRPATSRCRSRRNGPWASTSGRAPTRCKEIGERWRPWRGVAARLLWAYYAALKQKGSAVPV